MKFVPAPRTTGPALLLAATALGCAVAGAAAAPARPAAAAPGPPKTIVAGVIARPPHTLASGSKVRPADLLGQRVFTDATHGFALAGVGSAQYPATTGDGGRTWKTDGPALHLNAAQAPLAVIYIGAASRNTVFAWGTGQVIDATSNGGKQWYRAFFQGLPVAVIRNPQGHLVAFVDGSSGTGAAGLTWQYVSKNGGRTWRYDTTVGGS